MIYMELIGELGAIPHKLTHDKTRAHARLGSWPTSSRNARSGEFVTPVTRCAGSRWRGLQICSGAGTNRTAWAVAIEHQERQEWGVCYPCDQVRQLQLVYR